jgi:hypothetical protein
MGTSRDGDELFSPSRFAPIAHRPKSSEARANQRSAIFRSGSSVTASVCTRSRKHTNAGVHANPIASASYEDFSVVPFIQLTELGKIVPKWGSPLPVWKNSRASPWCQDCVGSKISSLQLTTNGRDAADADGAVSCQYRRIFQSFRRIVRPEVHCPASRPWRPTKSMNEFVTTRAFGVYGHSQRPSPRSAAPRPLRHHVDTALNDVGIADPWPESSSSFLVDPPTKGLQEWRLTAGRPPRSGSDL